MVSAAAAREIARAWARNPFETTKQLLGAVASSNETPRLVAGSLGVPVQSVRTTFEEADNMGLDSDIKASVRVSNMGLQPSKVLYVVCRVVKPSIVVETGVAEGISSAFMLKAMQENGQGTLYSIDAAERAEDGGEIGFVIPEGLKGRWRFCRGWSQQVLPRLLGELGEVDLFLHDSDHAYSVVQFELESVYPHLRRGGILAADDVYQTCAYFDTCKKLGIRPTVVGWRIGLALKRGGQGTNLEKTD